LGRREEASEEYREAIKARPGYVNAHYNLGRVLIELGSGGEGVDELRKALKLNPSSSKARHELGKFLYQQGQRKEGIEEMNGAVDLDPSSTAIKNDLAWMLATAPESSLRNGPRSLELAVRAENENPGPSPMILRTLAAAFAEIGDYPKAREAAGLALKLSKASSDAALVDDLSRKIILLESEKPLRDP
jgi:tetratricopeptide (TPR) repeat protein